MIESSVALRESTGIEECEFCYFSLESYLDVLLLLKRIVDSDVAGLAALTQMKYLGLGAFPSITDCAVAKLASSMPDLWELNISGTSVTKSGMLSCHVRYVLGMTTFQPLLVYFLRSVVISGD